MRNIAKPLRFENVQSFAGFSAEHSKEGTPIKVWTRLFLTSDDPLFHQLVENLADIINNVMRNSGPAVNLRRSDTVLLVFKPNKTAEIWLDTAAVSVECRVNRSVKAGAVIFENDIADVTGMSFPCADFGPKDKVLCIFRQGWRFGFAFDTNPEGAFDLKSFNQDLGSLYRHMRYKDLYDAIRHTVTFNRLLSEGWFPFVEIIHGEFKDILSSCVAGFDLVRLEESIVLKFDAPRLDKILDRWLSKPHFHSKEDLIKAAFNSFKANEPIAVIKILLTEIEGILNDAYRSTHDGQGAKLKELLKFAEESGERKAGGPNTLFFPEAFGSYLRHYTYANFDPRMNTGTASSRHAVGHGAAAQDSYTKVRALKVILALDQLAFYT